MSSRHTVYFSCLTFRHCILDGTNWCVHHSSFEHEQRCKYVKIASHSTARNPDTTRTPLCADCFIGSQPFGHQSRQRS